MDSRKKHTRKRKCKSLYTIVSEDYVAVNFLSEASHKKCASCENILEIKEYRIYKKATGGLYNKCKGCEKQEKKEYFTATKGKESYKELRKKINVKYIKNNSNKRKATCKQYYEKLKIAAPEKILDNRLKTTYGITLEEYNKKREAQNYTCAICKKHELATFRNKLAVDHNHNTGKVRGLLCDSCNWALGYAKEDITILLEMINYIKKYSNED